MSLFYLWFLVVLLPRLHSTSSTILYFGCAMVVGVVIIYLIWDSEDTEGASNFINKFRLKLVSIVLCICLVFTVIIPGKQDIAIIISGNFATNIEGLNQLPVNMIKRLNDYLDVSD